MSVALLDVNALFALFWENHAFHVSFARWFASDQNRGWATCPITEQGFVRIVSNAAYVKPAPRVRESLDLLEKATASNRFHEFWADELPLSSLHPAVRQRIRGHQQLTDAYLLSLAIHRHGKLITFDRRMLGLAPEGSMERAFLEILS